MRAAIGIVGLVTWLLLGAIGIAVLTGAMELPGPLAVVLMIVDIAAFIAFGAYILPLSVYGDRMRPDGARVASVEGSRRLAATVRTAGRVGAVQYTWPLLAVTVYEGGVVFKPSFLDPFAILRGEILRVSTARPLVESVVEIHHTSAEVESPVSLSAAFGGETVVKLLGL